MIEKEPNNQQIGQQSPPAPATPLRIATIRLVNDLIILAVTLIFTIEALDQAPVRYILMGVSGIAISTLIGYFFTRRGRPIIGMGFMIYGMVLGLTFASIFAEKLGPFTLVTLVLVTTLMVSYNIPQRRVIEAISASLIFGSAAMIFDLNFRGAPFRLPMPQGLPNILWGIIIVLSAIFLYLLIQQFPRFSLRAKIITAFAIVTVISISILGFFYSRSVESVLTQEANQTLFNAASQTEDSLRQFIDFNLQAIHTEARLPVLVHYAAQSELEREAMTETVTQTLQTLAQKDAYIASYAMLDLQGNVLIDTNSSNIGANESMLSAFTSPIANGNPAMSNVEMDPMSHEPSLYFSAPIIENENIIVGILRTRYDAYVLQDLIEKSNDRGGNNSFAVLFDENHIHLAHGIAPETIFTSVVPLEDSLFEELIESRRLPQQSEEETFLDLPDLNFHLRQTENSENGVVYFDAEDIATGDRLNRVVVLDLGNPSWLLAFFQPQEIYLEPVENLTNTTIFLSLLAGFGSVLVSVILTQILVAPIMKLNESVQEISQGKLDTQVEIMSDDEIGTLAKTFNAMTSQLSNLVGNLEKQVEARTRHIQNKAAQLQAATEVARDATTELDLNEMLDRASTLIQDRFGFYHVGIYLKDSQSENTVLASSQDDPGKKLIDIDHRYKVDVESNVGFVCILGEHRRASVDDPSTSLIYHPLLPNSQSQLVLPLNLANETIGAIDIHSTNQADFSEDDVQIFMTIADQLAIAIQKARYNQEVQETLNELETAYGTFTEKSWQRFIQNKAQSAGYRFHNMKTEPVFESPEQVQKVWKNGEANSEVSTSPDNPANKSSALAVPIKVRGEVISVLNLEFETEQIPPDINDLVVEIADRLSLIIENARLIETAKMQVDREQLASHITNTIRQSLDMDVVIRTAVQEIGQALGLPEVEIRLGTTSQQIGALHSTNNGSGNASSME